MKPGEICLIRGTIPPGVAVPLHSDVEQDFAKQVRATAWLAPREMTRVRPYAADEDAGSDLDTGVLAQ